MGIRDGFICTFPMGLCVTMKVKVASLIGIQTLLDDSTFHIDNGSEPDQTDFRNIQRLFKSDNFLRFQILNFFYILHKCGLSVISWCELFNGDRIYYGVINLRIEMVYLSSSRQIQIHILSRRDHHLIWTDEYMFFCSFASDVKIRRRSSFSDWNISNYIANTFSSTFKQDLLRKI